jgi:hypothetical protein
VDQPVHCADSAQNCSANVNLKELGVSAMPDFDDLQNGLYNFMVHTLGFTNENNFQFIQPGVSLPANTADAAVWSFMNEIPLLSLVEGGERGKSVLQ